MPENYQFIMEKLLPGLGKGLKLALHVCCAPCAIPALERLMPHFEITLFYYNPNIYPDSEYQKRLDYVYKLLDGLPGGAAVSLAAGLYERDAFIEIAAGRESEAEGGTRCRDCIKLRLRETARFAAENGFDYFCSTLTTGTNKNAVLINSTGGALAEEYGVPFLPSDFKKREGFIRSIEVSDKLGIYRQSYCGCEYGFAAK